MPKSPNQKLKLLYLRDILLEKTDENNPMTVAGMIDQLGCYGIRAERKSIYDDLEALRVYGLDIEVSKRKTTGYYVQHRDFELPELKILVDSVQASKFITHKKSAALIKKLESLCSSHDAKLLQRQVYVANRIKSMNESIYYNIDKIHNAIGASKKISFRYIEYTVTKEKQFRRNGERYIVSPYALACNDDKYYMRGYEAASDKVKNFRVDKMNDINIMDAEREGQEHFTGLDMAVFAKKIFSMFEGEEETVRLEFADHLIGAAIDRFGKDIKIYKSDDHHFTTNVQVMVSRKFFGWLSGYGKDARIIGPQKVADQMKEHIEEVRGLYQ